eukprot:tig00020951_g16418.t1
MPKSKQLRPQQPKAVKPQPKALPATKAPKFKALGPLQRAKAKADLRPCSPKEIAKEASSHRPDWPAPAPYRYLKLDKSNDTGFTRRRWPEPLRWLEPREIKSGGGIELALALGGGGADLEEQALLDTINLGQVEL